MDFFKNEKLKLVFYSPNFHPMVGGLENVVKDLALEITKLGHQVKVITLTKNIEDDPFPFTVIRRPNFLEGCQIIQEADILIQFNVSLKGMPLWVFSGTPLIVSHQGENPNTYKGVLKNWIANNLASKNMGCSQYIAKKYKNSEVIPNPYDHELFRKKKAFHYRKKDLVFLGRLVSDKGVNLLIKAVYAVRKNNLFPTLTIIGKGPEESKLRKLVTKYMMEAQVQFAGQRTGEELVDLLNDHKIMVIPSIWQEPFGIVALEGAACGCLLIGSDRGGLKEAIGPCGYTFSNIDENALASILSTVLNNLEAHYFQAQAKVREHLKKHQRTEVAKKFVDSVKKILD